MKFLKANLFLLATVVVAIGGGAALYFMGGSASAKMDQSLEARVSLDQRVTGMTSGAVNQKCIDALKERIALAKKERMEKADGLLKKNSAAYSVLTFDLKDKKPKAFPYDEKQYTQLTLWNQFPQECDKALTALLDKVKPTVSPSEEERKDELSRVKDPNAPAGSTPGMPMGMGMPPMGAPGMGSPAVMPGSPAVMGQGGPAVALPPVAPRGSAAASQPAEGVSPAEKALRGLVWAKSQQGWVYADKSSLFSADKATQFPLMLFQASQDYKPEDYWMMQVGLWVQQDILDAIQRTNQAAQEAKDRGTQPSATTEEKAKDVGVCVSPVKRLINTSFRGYVVKAGGATPAVPAAGGEPAVQALQYVKTYATDTKTVPPSLTGRSCNGVYDVVHYEFTVIISPRYLRQLFKNLRQSNLHTILEVEISSATDAKEATDLSANKENVDAWYYYGTDAVVKARIVGEMLLMTDWTRGRWDETAKNWDANYPPLMPVQMLERFKEYDPACLRKVDTDRTTTSGSAAPAQAGAAGPSGAPVMPGTPSLMAGPAVMPAEGE